MNKDSCITYTMYKAMWGNDAVKNEDRKTWVGRFSLVSPWFPNIIACIKRDCKHEHLRIDPLFVRQNFGGSPLHRITMEEIRSVYLQHILSGNERLAEFVANRWLFRNMEMYRFFESFLQQVLPNFEQISELPVEVAENLLKDSIEKFGVEKVFCFVAINEVVLPRELFESLQRQALEQLATRQADESEQEDSSDSLLRLEMDRLKIRHEKKVAEMVKKHQIEVSRLTQEITTLKKEVIAHKPTKTSSR